MRERFGIDSSKWRNVGDPPDGEPGKWSRDVIAITNRGRAWVVAYFGTKEEGCWLRPHLFELGEEIEVWTELVKDEGRLLKHEGCDNQLVEFLYQVPVDPVALMGTLAISTPIPKMWHVVFCPACHKHFAMEQ